MEDSMKVQDVSVKAKACGPNSNLAEAAHLMWSNDCGAIPVVDDKNKVVGVITDRDICIALSTRNRLAKDVAVRDVMSTVVRFCMPDDDVKVALKSMQEGKIRRLPVVNKEGVLQGIVSLNDLILRCDKKSELSSDDVLKALKAISQHRGKS
jgi:CBS domain-containing protein